ncbi:WXG100 family type VII secretion target [Paractinoplanes hotanensis]|uniref:WXG100 family type VII secretion target n=1 Tax=Paractinoplanes hotanensis TaxID=2906497 RepID=A0ABT0YG65_9ACTN|nr:WXG100 family type VII secretion target [Actinoplanes hotanensis]MCM4084244.1 WXG100 family type VII secretion target [Actinoplanes hotanensis]
MSDFDVLPEHMDEVANQLGRLPGQVQDAISTLMGKVALYADLNNGTAIDAYQRAQAEWNAGLGEVNEGVGKAAPILHNIAQEFRSGDSRAAGLFPV